MDQSAGNSQEEDSSLFLCKLGTMILWIICICLLALYCLFKHDQESGEDQVPQTYQEYITRKTDQIIERISIRIRMMVTKNTVFMRFFFAASGSRAVATNVQQNPLGNRNIIRSSERCNCPQAGSEDKSKSPSQAESSLLNTSDANVGQDGNVTNKTSSGGDSDYSSFRIQGKLPSEDEEVELCTPNIGKSPSESKAEEMEQSLSPSNSLASIPDSLAAETSTEQHNIPDTKGSLHMAVKESRFHLNTDMLSPPIDTDNRVTISGPSIPLKEVGKDKNDGIFIVPDVNILQKQPNPDHVDSEKMKQCLLMESMEQTNDNDIHPDTERLVSRAGFKKESLTVGEDKNDKTEEEKNKQSNRKSIDIKGSRSKDGSEAQEFLQSNTQTGDINSCNFKYFPSTNLCEERKSKREIDTNDCTSLSMPQSSLDVMSSSPNGQGMDKDTKDSSYLQETQTRSRKSEATLSVDSSKEGKVEKCSIGNPLYCVPQSDTANGQRTGPQMDNILDNDDNDDPGSKQTRITMITSLRKESDDTRLLQEESASKEIPIDKLTESGLGNTIPNSETRLNMSDRPRAKQSMDMKTTQCIVGNDFCQQLHTADTDTNPAQSITQNYSKTTHMSSRQENPTTTKQGNMDHIYSATETQRDTQLLTEHFTNHDPRSQDHVQPAHPMKPPDLNKMAEDTDMKF